MAFSTRQTGKMAAQAAVDVSVLLPFRDDEDIVGTACSKLAAHIRELGFSFELLAIEEDSGDNSHAVLGLLRDRIPELQVLYANSRDRGYATGASQARGRVVLMIDAQAALKPLAAISRGVRRVIDDEVDAVFSPDRFAVCHRTRTSTNLASVRGRRLSLLRRKLTASGSRVDELAKRKRRWLRSETSEKRPLGRLIAALMLPRS